MNIQEIIKLPQVIEKNHESLYRSYHILRFVMVMIDRGDSKETILEVVDFMQKFKSDNNS